MKKFEKAISYDEYNKTQISRSGAKWNSETFLTYNNEIFHNIVEEVFYKYGLPKNICCMGIRNGNEYLAFKDLKKGIDIYGVDINPKVTEVGDNCFCFDFTKLPKEWENKFDMVYSNSIDHSFNIQETIAEWHRVTKNDGLLLITYSQAKTSITDQYQFILEDGKDIKLFTPDKFTIERVWRESGQDNDFNGLYKVKK